MRPTQGDTTTGSSSTTSCRAEPGTDRPPEWPALISIRTLLVAGSALLLIGCLPRIFSGEDGGYCGGISTTGCVFTCCWRLDAFIAVQLGLLRHLVGASILLASCGLLSISVVLEVESHLGWQLGCTALGWAVFGAFFGGLIAPRFINRELPAEAPTVHLDLAAAVEDEERSPPGTPSQPQASPAKPIAVQRLMSGQV